ncbi:MAG: DUF222 domain-containing protein, partial [Frankiales bacterium]|nr:DUF222 domain-containing protein [Frankiales bacterium]
MHETPTPPQGPLAGAGRDEDVVLDQGWLDECALWEAGREEWVADGCPGPERFDDERWPAEDLLSMRGAVSEWDLPLLVSVDPASLDREDALVYLRRVEAVTALVAGVRARALVAVAGADGSDSMADRHAAMEVGVCARVGEGAAASAIATARVLHGCFPGFLAALDAGEVSEWHCRELVAGTRHVTDPDTVAALGARLLPRARRVTPARFRGEVARAVADLDAARASERRVRARAGRYVSCRPLEDGMGFLGVVSDWPTISAMHAVIDADGRALAAERGGAAAARAGEPDAGADAARADAFAARVLGRRGEDGTIVWDTAPAQVTLTVVMDLDTLRGEADRHALLDGEPVPAPVGREYAAAATAWRRAVTDPVTGHLLDHGTTRYLPDRLRDYVLARDHCRAPGCTTRATSRLEMDHAVPFPDGPSSAANCGGLCRRHHQLKTAHLADLT